MNKDAIKKQIRALCFRLRYANKQYHSPFFFCLGLLFLTSSPQVQASPNAVERCGRALSKKAFEKPQTRSDHKGEIAGIIDELVTLILNARASETTATSWRDILGLSLVAKKRAEIESMLGEKAAKELFLEVQARVFRHLTDPKENSRIVVRGSETDRSEKTPKRRVLQSQLVRSFVGHTEVVTSAVFSNDGLRILTASVDGTWRFWEVKTGRLLRIWRRDAVVFSAELSPDGSQILSREDLSSILWDINSDRILQRFDGHNGFVQNSSSFSHNGAQVLTAARDRTSILWDVKTGKSIQKFDGHSGHPVDSAHVFSSILSPDGLQVLTISDVMPPILWDVETAGRLLTFEGHDGQVTSADISPNGLKVLTGSKDKTARLWDAKTGQLLETFWGHGDSLTRVVFSPDGLMVLTASENSIVLWDAKTARRLHTFPRFGTSIMSVEFSPDGSQVLVALYDKTAELWSLYQDLEVGGG